ncbi:hypothetical protein LJC45_02745 [Alistipes sp. OttesenSCG-928-B03]|nr:hypothetical protein [Alistipes sp. OttesenSCG-928-B03]
MTIQEVEAIVKEALERVKENPAYPDTKHRNLAATYPDGEKAYYKKTLFDLLAGKEGGFIKTPWIDGGMPPMDCERVASILHKWVGQNFMQGVPELNKRKAIANEAEEFIRLYYRYHKLKDATTPGGGIPAEFQTKEALEIMQGMINSKFVSETVDGYKWEGQSNELAAFADISSESLGIRPSNNRIPWRLYKQLFGLTKKEVDSAKGARNDYNDEGAIARRSKPDKWDIISEICNI